MPSSWSIADFDIFSGIPSDDISHIATSCHDKVFAHKQILYTPKEPIAHLFIVKEGEVILYHSREGKRSVFDVIGAGDVFGNFQPTPRGMEHFAEAAPGSKICKLPIEEYLNVVRAHPEVMLQTLHVLAERLRDYEQKIGMCSIEAKDKVFRELKRYQKKTNRAWFSKKLPPVKITHQKLADLSGLNRVTVTRALHELADAEQITITDSGAITFND